MIPQPVAVDGAILVQDFLTMPRHEDVSRGLCISSKRDNDFSYFW